MDKNELIAIYNEGTSVEEIATLSNLEELKQLIQNSNLSDSIKQKMQTNIDILIKDTLWHSQVFSDLIKEAVK